MIRITVTYGMQSVTVERPEGTTVGALVNDNNLKAVIGYGENVTPVVEGATVDLGYACEDGDEVILQARAATKARVPRVIVELIRKFKGYAFGWTPRRS
jgi:hypothetical protein